MKSKAKKDKKLKKRLIRYIPLYIMALPGLLYLFINNYMPLPGLVLAFKKYNAKKGIFGSANVGFKNFKYLFATKDAFVITRNTILYNVVFIIVNTVLAVFVAILLAEMTSKLKKTYQIIILLPFMISMVIVSYLVFGFLSNDNGFLNNTILKALGKEPVQHELNLKKAAKVFGEKSLEMIPVAQINAVTGYIRGGCSPIGMKKNYRTVFDSSAQAQETMVVSGGKIGFQIEAKPDDLLRACGGVYADVLA